MTLPGNGALKKVLYGGMASIFFFLSMCVLSNSNRITAMEVKIESLSRIADQTLDQAERNRLENREEHKTITDKLDAIAAQVKNN